MYPLQNINTFTMIHSTNSPTLHQIWKTDHQNHPEIRWHVPRSRTYIEVNRRVYLPWIELITSSIRGHTKAPWNREDDIRRPTLSLYTIYKTKIASKL